jgi:DUF1365 family protein
MNSSAYNTTIVHQRFNHFKHKFKYCVLSLYIDYEELILLSNKIRLFSYNKFNIFSYYEKDHGYRDGSSLKKYVKDNLIKNKIIFNNLKIKILCFPRILGYVFNPLSIIYCYSNNILVAIFYEVKNTSNEQHTYLFASNDRLISLKYIHQCNKNFYVSPFIGMKALYKFKNQVPQNNMSIVIDLYDEKNQKILTASQYGLRTSLNSFSLLTHLIRNPFLTIKVMFAIIYESIFIVLKGGKYYKRKKKLSDTITFEGDL